MARYAIGDIQGCADELHDLLALIRFQPAEDSLYLVGDLVNRGPASLEVLRWAYRNQTSVFPVLGNHDLHLLACVAGYATPKNGDTISEILSADDCSQLCDWLRRQPLLRRLDDAVLVHAGIWPGWTLDQLADACGEVQAALAREEWRAALADMYGNKPAHWDQAASLAERWRFTINACTRMRFVDEHGALQLKFKGELDQAPAGLTPWFDSGLRKHTQRVICGHWSALGLLMRPDVWAIDTGCIWGGQLTAVCLDNGEITQVTARRPYQDVAEG
ncbi:symmetrical bis(5'-nucleosyl)-tetraphosphatase [Chitiniphilus eburneus]|uniref:bis(5'-nucleosyl)-tetraphosphatase (symmetrical) n=1 Tax=Chitiniphilus eburneus TaxID=2571148 RepID=A0A4U0PX30_9NEIS|nr:symmetrical bis(5'-nucleosyl)-tetraphosphatase [Chitiniphilus eburneus]TJZ73089.1 symmetrical bis(5'-nucleosyl)-tetraphosphatase [Chitiniphilus eburneus]